MRLVRLARKESCPGSVLEHLADTLAGPSRALEVLVGTNLLSDFLTLYWSKRVSNLEVDRPAVAGQGHQMIGLN